MVSKATYMVIAVAGIVAASGAARWYQKPKAQDAASSVSSAAVPSQGASSGAGRSGAGSKSPLVEVAGVEVARLTDDTQAVGSLRSRRSVVLRPEVSGRISRLDFTDGQRVRKGQVLVQFDDQLQQAQVLQSQAELSIALANQKRNQDLVAQNFVSQRALDESAANLQVAQARLALAKATAARLKIVAPFDGIAGIRQVSAGDYLKDGADIVNIEDIEAIFVDFRLPERFQAKLKRGQTAMLDIDALPGQQYLAQIQAIDPLIDINGRSVGVRACIDNRQLQLRPGMFARVNTVFGARDNARVIPEEAIIPQGGKQFVIKLLKGPNEQTRTTQRVEVKVGLRSPGKVEILDGLEPGDTVITTGQQRVQRDGTVVTVVSPGINGTPKPKAERAASPAWAAVQSSASAGALASLPAVPGSNPCGTLVSEARSAAAAVPTRKTAPASPAARNPA